MTRSTRLVVVALALGLSACSGPVPTSTFIEPDPAEPSSPLTGGPGTVGPPIAIDRDKELLVKSRAIVSGARSDGTLAESPWSFRHLVEALAPPAESAAFVSAWLASWTSTSTAPAQGSLALGKRLDVRAKLVCPWLRLTPANGCDETCSQCSSESLDLSRAPFRLLAIVNRLDLAETQQGCTEDAAEARFVFVATSPEGTTTLAFNVIFEYGANGTEAGDPKAWHALASLADERYAAALERITRSFTDLPRPSLKQVRTSENLGTASGTSWQLRQFERGDAGLVPTALTNTVPDAVDGTPALSDHVHAHFTEISSGDNAVTPALRTASSTMPRADFRWSDPAGDSGALDLFRLSTCNGCHAGHRGDTTFLPFSHVGSNEKGETVVSRFLDDPLNHTGDELAFRERSLARRLQGQCGSFEASYAGRRGGGGGGLERPGLPRRVH